jgi:hypothetical protein
MTDRPRASALLRWLCLAFLVSPLAAPAQASPARPIAWWPLDGLAQGGGAVDQVTGTADTIHRNYRWAAPSAGGGLAMDGFTTYIERRAENAPALGKSFTVAASIAPQTYPWNWIAFVDQDIDNQRGFFFGMDAEGRVGLQLAVGGHWRICRSGQRLPLMAWSQVVASFDPAIGVTIFVNGRRAGFLATQGDFEPAPDSPLRLGRNLVNLPPAGLVREKVSYPALYSYDGILRDVRIFSGALNERAAQALYDEPLSRKQPDLKKRTWPSLTSRSRTLQAAYTALSLYPEWDALWRTGPWADVVVTLPDLPIHYVFWRGANYGPSMVTENGIWFGDQSFEASTSVSTAEHMNDKHDAHASIRIEENSAARVVLRWRYALVDVLGNFAGVDPATGWGYWADEWIYIYPDGTAVRHSVVHGVRAKWSLTEPTLLLAPGQRPEDLLEPGAATVANASAAQKTYSWATAPPPFPFPDQPPGANIAQVNAKSRFHPFYIYRLGMELGPYGWAPEVRMAYSHFPVWDHWPVNQIPSDGRFELYPDHYASAAIMSPNPRGTWTELPEGKANTFLFGLTQRSITELARLDRSWIYAPPIEVVEGDGWSAHYDPDQKAYVLARPNGSPTVVKIKIDASEDSPLVNPAFVIDGWEGGPPVVKVNGFPETAGHIEVAAVQRLEDERLIVWLRRDATLPMTVTFASH